MATPPANPSPAASSRVDWLLFILLGFLWGSSYLFIKIGVDAGLQPFTLVTLRLLVGFVLLAVVVAAAREQLPRGLRTYGHLLVMAAFSVAIPFSLITWAEQSVDSTLASVLNGAVPLFVIVIAAIFLRDEPISINRLVGLAIGFLGVAILVGFDPADLVGGDLTAKLALIGSIGLLCHRCRLRAAHGSWPAPDDPGRVPGRVRPRDGRRAGADLRAPAHGADAPRRRSWRSSGSACSAPAPRTSSSSGCWAGGARPGPRWSRTCCRCSGSCSARSC